MIPDPPTAGDAPAEGLRRGSLRRRLLVIVMSATLAALIASAAALLVYEVRSYRSEGIRDLTSQGDLVAQSLAPTLSFDDARAAGQALAALQLRPQIRAAAAYRSDGTVFATYRAPGAASASIPPRPEAAGARVEGRDLVLFQAIAEAGRPVGTLYLRASHDLAARLGDYLMIVVLASAGGLGLAALIFRRLHPAVTGPILAVTDASRRLIADRNDDVRVEARADGEVGVLVSAFNNLLDDIARERRERQAAEAALRAADRRKDEFLATLAHELRNPLAPLANALAILQRPDADPALRGQARAIMERQLAQMVRLIDDLLEVSRITRGTLALRLEPVDVAAVARDALTAAEPALQARRHTVRSVLPASPVWARADAARLMQVFVNLLHNAARYTPEGGHVELTVAARGAVVEVSVRDDGIGIAPEDQGAVFEMFVQLDTTLERGAAGLGVGLTIARQIVELHGGLMRVESPGRGQGATFTVSLPLVAPPPPAERAPPATAAPAGAREGLSVLIADDNVDFTDSFAGVLRMDGHHVVVANDGNAALQAAIDRPPDIAFVDLGMPGLNGYDVARRFREQAPGASTVLVAVTGWGQESDRQRVMAAGFDRHWVKPVDIPAALRLLEAMRTRRRPGADGAERTG